MGDDHDRRSDRVDQEPGGAQVIPGGDQPDPPRPEIETDTGVRARPEIDGDDSSTSTVVRLFCLVTAYDRDASPTKSYLLRPSKRQRLPVVIHSP